MATVPVLGHARLGCATVHDFAHLAQRLRLPALLHSSALILASTSALSASSAAISSKILSGLRCVTSSPPFGFLTERSKVPLSILVASTLHDLSESARLCCRFRNSARSASLSGLVFPRLRPG